MEKCVALSVDSQLKALDLLNNKNSESAVETILQESSTQQEPLLVFADLSSMTTTNCLPLIKILATYVFDIRLVLSISSGARHFKGETRHFQHLFAHLQHVNITRFTEEEACSFLRKRNANVE